MKNEMLITHIDHDTIIAFTKICNEVGLSPSQAIKLFVHAVINHGGIPFDVKVRQPNQESIAAMQELVSGQGHTANSID